MRHEIIGPFPDQETFLSLKAHLERLGEKIPLSTIPPGDSIRHDEIMQEWVREGRESIIKPTNYTFESTRTSRPPTISPGGFTRKYRGTDTIS